MKRYLIIGLAIVWAVAGCESSNPAKPEVFRGNALSVLPSDGVLRVGGSPYLAVDTLHVPAGKTLTIEPGVELRFDLGMWMEVRGKIIARGTAAAPIIFTSGAVYPDRGDWDGIDLIDADLASVFEYCKFEYGAKYGRRYYERTVNGETEKAVIDYGALTLLHSSPTVTRCSFLANGFHGLQIDSLSNPTIESCLFYDNAGHGIFVHYSADPVIRYNIITENDDYGMFCKEPTDSPRDSIRFSYNLMWSNFSGEFNGQTPRDLGRITTTNANLDSCDSRRNLRLDPQFKDPTKWNFTLNPCSGAIDAGPEAASPRDPDGTRIELGTLQYIYRDGEIRRRIPNLPRIGNTLEAGKTYIMSCNILLPAGETLTIQPGATVKVEGQFRFRVKGKIIANGTSGSPISFTSAPEDANGTALQPKRGDWFGLIFEADGDEGSQLNYTNISYARWGVHLTRRNAVLDHCTISDCDSVGVMCDDQSTPVIRNCRLTDNSVAGILCQYNSAPQILRNRITGGAGYGIYARENSSPDIYNNLLSEIGTSGIRLENLSNPHVINNTIVLNGYYGINCEYNCDPIVKNNIFVRNGVNERGGIGILGRSTSEPVIMYNCFYKHAITAIDISTNRELPATNLTSDPKFTDYDKRDFHLQAGSPALTQGDPAISPQMGAYGGPNPLQ